MSRTGNPYDNPQAERFMRTVKYDEVYVSLYQTLSEERASVRHFIEEVYNRYLYISFGGILDVS